jgi:uncharacterized protein (UPF0332 family)
MFKWEDFLNFSQELMDTENNKRFQFHHKPALFRTIVSRSYYGIFKQVEDLLKDLEKEGRIFIPRRDKEGKRLGSHERIISFLLSQQDIEFKKFAIKLASLKRYRLQADYYANLNIDRRKAEEILNEALKLNKMWNENLKNTI